MPAPQGLSAAAGASKPGGTMKCEQNKDVEICEQSGAFWDGQMVRIGGNGFAKILSSLSPDMPPSIYLNLHQIKSWCRSKTIKEIRNYVGLHVGI